MKVSWVYSKSTEADRLMQICAGIVYKLYHCRGFNVLPYPKNHISNIYLPRLRYNTIKNYWKKLGKLTFHIPMPADKQLKDAVTKLYERSKLPSLNNTDIRKLRKQWDSVESQFFQELSNIIPSRYSQYNQIEIRPTRFGSLCSFDRKGKKISIYIRIDTDISNIAYGILSAMFLVPHKDYVKINGTLNPWVIMETQVDFLMQETKIAKLFPDHICTIAGISKNQNAKARKESQKYLKSLGFCNEPSYEYHQETDSVKLNSKPIDTIFTTNEKELMKLFTTNKNKIINNDIIADILWKNNSEEAYSLYAIAKTISRIRSKIEQLGANPCAIQAKRGEGYVLID